MVPFLDLLRTNDPSLAAELLEASRRVLGSGRYVQGPEVARFEKEFAAYCGLPHAIGVNSGTSALHLALLALGVANGDEVITVPLTFIATVSAIHYTGARPVLVDIDPRTYTLDPGKLIKAITPRTKAIVPVHLYGQMAEMDPILEIARARGLRVIEDACQAHGAALEGRLAGSIGDLGCFSFYPSKNLGACGEGGAVVTANSDYDRTIRMLRDWGQETKYRHVLRGFNYRMDELQATFLAAKLKRLDAWNESRRRVAGRYGGALEGTPFQLPVEREGARHVYHLYPVLVQDREGVRARLKAQGIETGIHYPDPIHRTPAFLDLGYPEGSFPVSERVSREELSLPMFPGMEVGEIDEVARALLSEALVG